MKQHNIFPECNVDTNLVGYILGGYAKHKSCCNEVVKAVNGSDDFAVGIIDADKRLATMDDGFVKYVQNPEDKSYNMHITMFVHQDGKRYMFTIKPAMDKFIADAVSDMGIDLRSVGYPSTFEAFKKETKRVQACNDPKLRQLFQLISEHPELKRFKNTLKYLMSKQYESEPAIAKQFFDGTLSSDDLAVILQHS